MTAKKRLLPILMAVLMVFAMMPMAAGNAYADEAAEPIDIINQCGDGSEILLEDPSTGTVVTQGVAGSEIVISCAGDPQLDPNDPDYNEQSGGSGTGQMPYLIIIAKATGEVLFSEQIGYHEQTIVVVPSGGIKIILTYDEPETASFTPLEQTITASDIKKTYGNAAFSLGAKTNGDGTLTYKSGNTKVATVSSAGKVTIKGAGTAKITISASATAKYKAASKTITITVNKAANPLKISPKTATVKYSKLKIKAQTRAVAKVITFTKKLNDKKTYTLVSAKKGSKNFKKYFKINKTTGKVTIKKNSKMKKGIYKVKVTVKAAGNVNYKPSAVKTVTFKVKVK